MFAETIRMTALSSATANAMRRPATSVVQVRQIASLRSVELEHQRLGSGNSILAHSRRSTMDCHTTPQPANDRIVTDQITTGRSGTHQSKMTAVWAAPM